MSAQLWALELYRFDWRWYLCVSASDGEDAHHRHYVLESAGCDPMDEYPSKGQMDEGLDAYATDGPVLQTDDGSLYWMYAAQHQIGMAPMETPCTVDGTRWAVIVEPTEPWERGWIEKPEVLHYDGRQSTMYSAGHSATPHYALGRLTHTGVDVLDPLNWKSILHQHSPRTWWPRTQFIPPATARLPSRRTGRKTGWCITAGAGAIPTSRAFPGGRHGPSVSGGDRMAPRRLESRRLQAFQWQCRWAVLFAEPLPFDSNDRLGLIIQFSSSVYAYSRLPPAPRVRGVSPPSAGASSRRSDWSSGDREKQAADDLSKILVILADENHSDNIFRSLDGRSLALILWAKVAEDHDRIFLELLERKEMLEDRWKAVALWADDALWRPYDLNADPTETRDPSDARLERIGP